jgi:hypothetical protein
MSEDLKVNPYQRLKNILTEGDEVLTKKASNNIDEILGITQKKTEKSIFKKFIDFFVMIDSKIFKRPDKIGNVYSRRKK